MNGFDVSLQVAVDGENLVAAWVGTGPLSHLLMVLFNVLLPIPVVGVENKKSSLKIGDVESSLGSNRLC